MKLYKILLNGESCHGGSLKWSLPTPDGPGEWMEYEGVIVPCRSGIHLTKSPAVWFDRPDLDAYEAEYDGECVPCSDDKVVCRRVRLVKKLTAAELESVAVFMSGSHQVVSGVAKAYGTANVEAYGTANVKAYDTVNVKAYGTVNVEAHDTVNVEAYGAVNVTTFSPRCRVLLNHLSVQISREDYWKVVVRHAPGAAATLESAKEQTDA